MQYTNVLRTVIFVVCFFIIVYYPDAILSCLIAAEYVLPMYKAVNVSFMCHLKALNYPTHLMYMLNFMCNYENQYIFIRTFLSTNVDIIIIFITFLIAFYSVYILFKVYLLM